MTKNQLNHTIQTYKNNPTRANALRVTQALEERRYTLSAQHMRMCMEVATQDDLEEE